MFFTTSSFAHTQSELEQLRMCSTVAFATVAFLEDEKSWAKEEIKYYRNRGNQFVSLIVATIGREKKINYKETDALECLNNFDVCFKKCETLYFNW